MRNIFLSISILALASCSEAYDCGYLKLTLNSSKSEVLYEVEGVERIYRKNQETEDYIMYGHSSGASLTYFKDGRGFEVYCPRT